MQPSAAQVYLEVSLGGGTKLFEGVKGLEGDPVERRVDSGRCGDPRLAFGGFDIMFAVGMGGVPKGADGCNRVVRNNSGDVINVGKDVDFVKSRGGE